MSKEWTEQDLRQLADGARAMFESVELTELPEAPQQETWQDDGLRVDYELCNGQVSCVMNRCIAAEGKLWQMRLAAPLAGNALPEDRMTEREREICRDDMNHDFLSGVFNRRYLETVFRAKLEEWAAANQPAAVALVALDGYDNMVRRYGQPSVDQVVCFVANQWRKHFDLPAERIVCRLTGSIFVVGGAGYTAKSLEDEMRTIYTAMPRTCVVSVGMMHRVSFTMTAACAGLEENGVKGWEELYCLCDERLRAAQGEGGNRVFSL